MSDSHSDSAPTYDLPPEVIPEGWIAIPRRVVFIQAFLLVAVGINAFICGVLFSRRSGGAFWGGAGNGSDTALVRGQIRSKEPLVASECLLMFLPVDARPQTPFNSELIGESIPPVVGDALRSLGAAWCWTDAGGNYQLKLPGSGEYHVLVLPRETSRESDAAQEELAEIGQYFVPAWDLVRGRRYVWLRKSFSGAETFDHDI